MGSQASRSIILPVIFSFVLPPVGWFMLWRGSFSTRAKKGVLGASVIWLLFVAAVAPSSPERHSGATRQGAQRAASTDVDGPEPPAANDPCVLIPTSLPGFHLVAVEPTGPMARFSERCEWPEYVANDESGITARAHIEENDIDEVPTGRSADGVRYEAIQVGEHTGAMSRDRDTGDTAIMWRSGPWFIQLWLKAERSASQREARRLAPEVADAFASWMDQGLRADEAARIQRVSAVEEAVASPEARAARQAEKLRRMVGQLPEWSQSARISRANELEVVVNPAWLLLPQLAREQQARVLWRDWAVINSPEDHDASHLRLVDSGGRRLGGSGMMGSSISVD